MRSRTLIYIIVFLGIGLAVLMFNRESGQSFGIDNDKFVQVLALAPFAALLSVGILRSGHYLPSRLFQLLIWTCVILALVIGYSYRDGLQAVSSRMIGELVPGRMEVSQQGGNTEVILRQQEGGHFKADVGVGPATVPMLLDTGATSIALSYADAIRAGIDPDTLSFTRQIVTANGRTLAAPVRLDTVTLGPIVRHDVDAVVTQSGQLDESLLGMSFLGSLRSMEMRSDRMTLID